MEGLSVLDDNREPGPPPPGVDVKVAHPARVWNFWLGGHDWFRADRLAGTETAQAFPHLPETARAERAFLVRATRYLAGPARIRQFLDLGSGLPAGGNTHEIAQRIAGHTSPATTRIYDRSGDQLTLQEIERVQIGKRPEI